MKRHRNILIMITALVSFGAFSAAMAGMESMTDDQMGAVQGMNGTIVSTNSASPQTLVAQDAPGMTNTTGAVIDEAGKQVFSPGSLTKEIHPTSESTDVLFSIHMNVESVTYRTNNTRMVEAWDGNRVDFQTLYNDMNH